MSLDLTTLSKDCPKSELLILIRFHVFRRLRSWVKARLLIFEDVDWVYSN